MANKKDLEKNKQAILFLSSDKLIEVEKGIETLEQSGQLSDIKSILNVFLFHKDHDIKRKLFHLLSNVSLKGAELEWMKIILEEKEPVNTRDILNICWNSKLNFSPFILEFVKIAINNDYLIAMECLTIIENLEGPFEESSLLESQILLKGYYENIEPKDDKKKYVIDEITLFISEQNDGMDADLMFN